MTEEIKEKLEAIASNDDIDLLWNEANDLLNYITNLQKEKDNYKQRNEKAIKWLERHIKMINGLVGNDDGLKGSIVLSDDVVAGALLYILQGGDE